jgi:HEAT repeat protein
MNCRTINSWCRLCVVALGLACCAAANAPDAFELLADREPGVRAAAIASLAGRSDALAVAALKGALADPEWQVQMAAAKILGPAGEKAILDELIAALDGDDLQQRKGCVLALAHSSQPRAFDALMAQCAKRNFAFRWQVGEAIGQAHNRRFIPMMLAALRKDADWHVQEVAAVTLAQMHDTVGIEPLLQSLQSKNKYARMIACWQLGRIGDPRAIDVLISDVLKKYDTYDDRVWAAVAIDMIGAELNPVFKVVVSDLANDRPEKFKAFEASWAKNSHRHISD